LAEPLDATGVTLRFWETPAEEHCSVGSYRVTQDIFIFAVLVCSVH